MSKATPTANQVSGKGFHYRFDPPTELKVGGIHVKISWSPRGYISSASKDKELCLEEQMDREIYESFGRGEKTNKEWISLMKKMETKLINRLREIGRNRRRNKQ